MHVHDRFMQAAVRGVLIQDLHNKIGAQTDILGAPVLAAAGVQNIQTGEFQRFFLNTLQKPTTVVRF